MSSALTDMVIIGEIVFGFVTSSLLNPQGSTGQDGSATEVKISGHVEARRIHDTRTTNLFVQVFVSMESHTGCHLPWPAKDVVRYSTISRPFCLRSQKVRRRYSCRKAPFFLGGGETGLPDSCDFAIFSPRCKSLLLHDKRGVADLYLSRSGWKLKFNTPQSDFRKFDDLLMLMMMMKTSGTGRARYP